jgi:hypothetical protein
VALDEKMASRHLKHVRFFFAALISYKVGMTTENPNISDTQSKSTIVNIASLEENRKNDDWFAGTDEARRYG